jgi:hypothetical protein
MVDPLSLGNSTRSMVAWSWGYGLHLKSIYPEKMSKPHRGPTRRDSPEPPCRFGRRVPHAVRVKVERWRRRHHRVREIENKVERERERAMICHVLMKPRAFILYWFALSRVKMSMYYSPSG